MLSYDPYHLTRTFIAKLLRKSPYEGCTWWREQDRRQPSGPVRIAYGPHTGILSIARARCEPSEHSEIEKKKEKAWWSYNKMLIDWVRSSQTGKYLALGHTPWPWTTYFPIWPSHLVNNYIIFIPSKRITNQNIKSEGTCSLNGSKRAFTALLVMTTVPGSNPWKLKNKHNITILKS